MSATLAISPYPAWPLHAGVVVRNHHLLTRVSELGPLTLVSRGPLAGPLKVERHFASRPGRWWQVLDPVLMGRLAFWARHQRIERVLACTLLAAPQALLLGRLCNIAVWLDLHNVESHLLSQLGHPLARPLRALERALVGRADRITCVSQQDAERLQRWSARPVEVYPNGTTFCPELPARAQARERFGFAREQVAIFFATLDYAPNREALDWLVSDFAPHFGGRVVVCGPGRRPSQLPSNLCWRGVENELWPLLRAADLALVPLRSGSGTRLKVLEALAAGLPVLSTPIGVEGLPWRRWGEWVTVAEREAFLDCARACARPAEAPELKDFHWNTIFAGLR